MSWPSILPRAVPPVLSKVSLGALVRAAAHGLSRQQWPAEELSREISRRLDAEVTLLTDSGTSALALSLRLTCEDGGVVALPGYGCPDLVSAALQANVRVRLYDIRPQTLSPEPESVQAVIDRGVDAIVVVHLFGFPADCHGVLTRARAAGIPVIEDAAQGAGGTLAGRLLGAIAPLAVLSFGRGKGITGGSGGALLIRHEQWIPPPEDITPSGSTYTAWGSLARALAQHVLGRASLYWAPSSVPFLRLGETVFSDPSEPRSIGIGNASLAANALGRLEEEATRRAEVAGRLLSINGLRGPDRRPCEPVEGGEPGYLRLPVLFPGREPSPALGILRGYPVTLSEMPQITDVLMEGEDAGPGARLLSRSLLTFPTHHRVTPRDLALIGDWVAAA